MALADINIRIGTEISQFQAGLRKAERELQRSADKFNTLGNNLSLAVSVPLAGLGFSALKSAGDIEALRLGFEATMTGAGKSTAEATAELIKLQKAAEAPGLDFEQAVKGSVRLQNVGFEAEQSRKILSELANAISLTGGNAQQLDGVTKQFAQMAGKGRILQEDLSILVENMPVLSKVLKDTFGTANAEGLRELGISTEEFILKTTEGLAKLERVPGGLNNAFTNAGVSIKLALANVGESINKAFDVTGKLETFSTVITDLAAGFASLDPVLQKTIVGFGLAAVSAGPLFKIIGGGIETFSTARSAALSFGKALEVSRTYFDAAAPALGNLSAGLGAAGKAWRALDTVAKGTVIGLALAAVVGLAVAFNNLAEGMGTAAQKQADLNDVTLQAEKNMALQRIEADKLIKVIGDENAKYDEKKAALDRLIQISPEYFNGLSLEKDSVEKITSAYDRYISNLKQAATAQAAQAKIIELESQRLDLVEELNKKLEQQKNISRPSSALGSGSGLAFGDTSELLQAEYDRKIGQIQARIDGLLDVGFKANQATTKLQQQAVATAGAPIGAALPTGAPLPTGSAPKAAAPAKFDGFKDVKNGLIIIEDQSILTNGELEKLATKTLPVLSENQNAYAVALAYTSRVSSEYLEPLAASNAELEKQNQFLIDLAAAAEGVIESGLQETLVGVGTAIGDVFSGTASAGSVLGAVLEPILGMVEQLGKIAIGTGIAIGGIKKALETLNPVAAIAAGVGLIALSRIVKGQLKSLQPKAFAAGGIITGPTYGLIGEAGPEVVFPLSDLKKFVGEAGGGGAVQVYGRLSGSDILLSSERSETRRKRTRGY